MGIQAVGGDQGSLQVAQLLLQALGEELLVEAGGWGLVGHWLLAKLTKLLIADRMEKPRRINRT